MTQQIITRWVIGITATCVWFWGDRAGIPAGAVLLASQIVPGLIGHTLGQTQQDGEKKPAAPPNILS